MTPQRQIKLLTTAAATAVAVATCAAVVALFPRESADAAPPAPVRATGAVLAAVQTVRAPATAADADAGAFVTAMIRMKHEGAWAESWDLLYPPHRAIVPRWLYVKCEGREPLPGTLESMAVVKVVAEPFRPAGDDAPLATQAVTIRFTISHPDLKKPYVFTSTFHAARDGGGWWWFLTEDRYASFARGACPV